MVSVRIPINFTGQFPVMTQRGAGVLPLAKPISANFWALCGASIWKQNPGWKESIVEDIERVTEYRLIFFIYSSVTRSLDDSAVDSLTSTRFSNIMWPVFLGPDSSRVRWNPKPHTTTIQTRLERQGDLPLLPSLTSQVPLWRSSSPCVSLMTTTARSPFLSPVWSLGSSWD